MKKIMTVAIALSGLVFSSVAAQPGFGKIKIDAELYPAPVASYRGGGVSYAIPTKSRVDNKWLMLKIEYTPALEKNSFSTVSPRGGEQHVTTRGWLDNVELSVQVLLDTGIVYQKKNVFALFTGKCCFWSIRQDGQKHTALMFVPGQLIDRYFIGNNWNGTIRQAAKNNFIAAAQFSHEGTILGKSYFNLPTSKSTKMQIQFDQLLKNVPPQLRLENSILPRSKSPWSGYYPEAFDLEKEHISVKQ